MARASAEWKASGLSRDAFAKGKAFSERSLGWWCWKLKSEGEKVDVAAKRRARRPKKQVMFVELRDEPVESQPLMVRVGGVEVVVPDAFETTTLERLVALLEARR